MPFRILATLLILLLPTQVFADASKTRVSMPILGYCNPGTVNLCGTKVPVPAIAYGSSAVVQMPFPYQHDPFTVMCAGTNNQSAVLELLDVGSVSCTLLKCATGTVKMCGTVDIPVEGGVIAGRTRDEVVPPEMLIDPQYGEAPFRTKCVGDDDGNPVYAIDDDTRVSCNRFPCPDSVITMCSMGIALQGGAALGDVLNMTMPPPFVPDPYTVQCLGSNAKAPQYQITDSAAVTCTQASAQ